MQRKFIILTSLGGLNTTVFATCYGIASTDNGSSFAGLIPAVICYGSVFASMFLGAFAVYYYKEFSAKILLSTLLALAPFLFRVAHAKDF